MRIYSENLNFVELTKYLGLFIDRKLTFTEQIETICKKSKNIVLLYRISLFSPGFILERLYYAFIFPYMSYCNLIWGGIADTHIDKIFKLQKRAVPISTKSEYLQHTEPLFVQLRVIKIRELFPYSCCIYVFKNIHLYQPPVRIRNTRSNDTVRVMFQRLSLCQRSVYFSAAKVFNELPVSVSSLTKFSAFKRSVKKFLLGDGSNVS